jgi:phasin
MDKNTKTTATKPADFPKTEAPQVREMTGAPQAVRETAGAPQAIHEMAEKSATQAKETYEKMNAATTEAADLIKNSYSTAVNGVQDYNKKFVEFAHANTNAAFDFVQKLSGVKSPSAFIELSTEHARKQLETLTEQTTQLLALAQKATLATAEPLKTGAAKAFNHAP